MGKEKRYRLLKDTPEFRAGSIFYLVGNNYEEITYAGRPYNRKFVESNPDWFELIEDAEKDTDELIAIQFILKDKPYRWCQTKESWAKYIDSIIKYERLYSKKELLEAKEAAFYAARKLPVNQGNHSAFDSNIFYFPTFSDYENSNT